VELMRKRIMHGAALALFAAFACALAGSATARTLAAPTLTGFAPTHGLRGEKVTIYGHNLTGAQVQFNGVQATNVMIDTAGTHITVNVPIEVADGPTPITVITPEGTVATATMFTVNPPSAPTKLVKPRISSFAPLRGKSGTRVTIKGSHLGGALWVKFGGVKATFTVPSATKIVALVPKKAHSGQITVRTSGGLATSGSHFMFRVIPGI
jgi:hypothetical protein